MLDRDLHLRDDLKDASGARGVTNFDAADLRHYEKAVAEFGDTDLFVSGEPMPPKTTGYCLRDRQDRRDLSAFWRIFRVSKYGRDGWSRDATNA